MDLITLAMALKLAGGGSGGGSTGEKIVVSITEMEQDGAMWFGWVSDERLGAITQDKSVTLNGKQLTSVPDAGSKPTFSYNLDLDTFTPVSESEPAYFLEIEESGATIAADTDLSGQTVTIEVSGGESAVYEEVAALVVGQMSPFEALPGTYMGNFTGELAIEEGATYCFNAHTPESSVVTVGSDNSSIFWNIADPSDPTPEDPDEPIYAITINEGDNYIISSNDLSGQTVNIYKKVSGGGKDEAAKYDLLVREESGEWTATIPGGFAALMEKVQHNDPVVSIAQLVVASGNSSYLHIWSVSSNGADITVKTYNPLVSQAEQITVLTISSDGSVTVSS